MDEIIKNVLAGALPVLFAITVHEAAHAYAAKYFGDATAYLQGRVSLNPVKHIDPIGTIVLPLAMFIMTAGSFLIGYAKPVPVYFGNLRNPKRDMAWVALAGPAANFIMALLWFLLSLVLEKLGIHEKFFDMMVQIGIMANLLIMAFNLFPVPPLDGGRIVISLLPDRLAYKYGQLERYGFFIVLGLVVAGVMSWWMQPVMWIASQALLLITSPLH